jgi:glycosyltransferase involved in cell wall biosynthesis
MLPAGPVTQSRDRLPVAESTSGQAPENRLRRVLYAIVLDPSHKFGSLEEQIMIQARAFRARDSLFMPLFITDTSAEKALGYGEAGLPVACLDLRRFRLSTLRRLLRLITEHSIEVVHWNMCSPLHNKYVWLLTLLRPRLRHYFTDHNSRILPAPAPAGRLARFFKRLLLRRYARVLGVSRFVFDSLRQQQTWSNLGCCLHFINTDRFKPDPDMRTAVRKRQQAEGKFVVLTVAFLIPEKGIDVLLRALPELPPEVVVWVAGAGPERGRLEALAREGNVLERVCFLGSQQHVEPFMQAADCFVCPSLWAEAAGLVNLESQASGLPLVASRIGGIPEYLAEGQSGLLFTPGDHRELAAHLRRLHESPSLRERMGQAARALVVERFSPEARLEAYLDLYRSE